MTPPEPMAEARLAEIYRVEFKRLAELVDALPFDTQTPIEDALVTIGSAYSLMLNERDTLRAANEALKKLVSYASGWVPDRADFHEESRWHKEARVLLAPEPQTAPERGGEETTKETK